MQMQISKYVHIKIRKGSKEKSSDHSCLLGCLFCNPSYQQHTNQQILKKGYIRYITWEL